MFFFPGNPGHLAQDCVDRVRPVNLVSSAHVPKPVSAVTAPVHSVSYVCNDGDVLGNEVWIFALSFDSIVIRTTWRATMRPTVASVTTTHVRPTWCFV